MARPDVLGVEGYRFALRSAWGFLHVCGRVERASVVCRDGLITVMG